MSGQDYLGTNVEEERLVTPSKVNTEGKPATKFLEPELEQLIFQRGMGVVLPIFSLPSPYGIGTFGDEAYRFCDFLEESGVRYWQLLPMGPTSYGDSPYSSFSSFAGNPYFIDLDFLCKAGLLQREEIAPINFGSNPGYVDYALQYNSRFRLLFRAFSNRTEEMKEQMQLFYEEEKDWLHDYALFMAIKKEQMDVAWLESPEPYRFRDPKALQAFEEEHGEAIEFQIFIQYLFFEQWKALKEYAHSKNIQFIGDLPIYVALDSVDVWANPEAFLLVE